MALLHSRNLRLHARLVVGVSVLLVVVWALTPHANFWPQYAIVPLALALGVHAWFALLEARPEIRRLLGGSQLLAAQVGISTALWLYFVAIWATAPGYFWPAWPLLGLGLAAGIHVAVLNGRPPTAD